MHRQGVSIGKVMKIAIVRKPTNARHFAGGRVTISYVSTGLTFHHTVFTFISEFPSPNVNVLTTYSIHRTSVKGLGAARSRTCKL